MFANCALFGSFIVRNAGTISRSTRSGLRFSRFWAEFGHLRSRFLVFIKINFFAWITVAWIGMGHTWSYEYDYSRAQMSFNSPSVVAGQPPAKKTRAFRSEAYFPREIDMEVMFAFGLSALAYGAFGRMFLLRWRKGWRVGLVMSGVVIAAIVLGAFWRKIDMEIEPSPLSGSFIILLTSTATALTLGTSIVWGIWVAMGSPVST